MDTRRKRENILISIVIPTYRRSNTLRETLSSIAKQKRVSFAWEVIVVDNEPSDSKTETENVIREFQNLDIAYYRHEKNIGVEGNYNRGIELATGTWVAFLHDDDMLVSDYLFKMGAYIKKLKRKNRSRKEVGAIRATFLQFRTMAKIHEYEKSKDHAPAKLYDRLCKNGLWRFTKWTTLLIADSPTGIPSCGTLLLKKAIMEVGGFDDGYGICGDMYPGYFMLKHYRIYVTNKVMRYYRWEQNTSMKSNSLFELVKSKKDFMNKVYHDNFVFYLFGKVFGRVHFNQSVDYRESLAGKLHIHFSRENTDKICKYKECLVRTEILLEVYRLYFAYKYAEIIWNKKM